MENVVLLSISKIMAKIKKKKIGYRARLPFERTNIIFLLRKSRELKRRRHTDVKNDDNDDDNENDDNDDDNNNDDDDDNNNGDNEGVIDDADDDDVNDDDDFDCITQWSSWRSVVYRQ